MKVCYHYVILFLPIMILFAFLCVSQAFNAGKVCTKNMKMKIYREIILFFHTFIVILHPKRDKYIGLDSSMDRTTLS